MIHLKYFRKTWITFHILLCCAGVAQSQLWNPNHAVGTITGKYHYNVNQTPDQLIELAPAGLPTTGQSFQWEYSYMPLSGFVPLANGSSATYTFAPTDKLTQTTYIRRRTTNFLGLSIYSNTIKLHLVSLNWEDYNYIREHDVLTTGVTTWTAVDQLPIGQKHQNTTYVDNLGRPIQRISREIASPASGSLWGDVVEFFPYDAFGRETVKYLPYTTTTETGKYKTNPITQQASYYTTVFNETSPFSTYSYDNSPSNKITNIKQPGTAWAAGIGLSMAYDMNGALDSVYMFTVDYVQGNPPTSEGYYPANTLFKLTSTDENGKKVIEYINKDGQLILKKIQEADVPSIGYKGWICTYNIYDDFGRLRYKLQPMAVAYLVSNSWSFAGVNGQQILNEQCFLYSYDDRGRCVWKKQPGALGINNVYDKRDRVVFTQDGRQSTLATPQWMAHLYDELNRPVASVLYNTTKTRSALQTDVDNAPPAASITITNAANNAGQNITINPSLCPLTATDLNNPAVTTVLKYKFYDNYTFPRVKTFNTNYTNLNAYATSDPNVVPIGWSKRTIGLGTGELVRVLGSNNFIATTYYYDEKGRMSQLLEDNIKSGTDITTSQYHFANVLLSTCVDHTTPGTGYTNFKVLTKYIYDQGKQISSIQKQFGTNAMETVANYEYDDFGRMKNKVFDPGYTAGGNANLESLSYSYNLHNQITGINKDFALKNPSNYNKWGHFFGMYIGYDNRDNVFAAAQLNSQVTGIIWNTQGDDVQRKYNYSYDNANRLMNAAFTQQDHPGDGWSNAKVDFSVTGSSGKITYDLNGNLLNLLQKGIVPGSASPITIDNLTYTYGSNSNKVASVTDQMTTPAVNGQFGDLKDGANGANPDFVHDNSGNIIIDLNKNSQSLNGGAAGTPGVSYNYLDKPELIRIVGKGTIRIIYSAEGEKLQRAFIPEAGGAGPVTSYLADFVYEESATITTSTPAPLGGTAALSFINFEEGRIRVVTPVNSVTSTETFVLSGNLTLPNGKMGVYDYFVRDYLENVRMVLTEEIHSSSATATMETARTTFEESIFGQPGAANEVPGTRVPKPAAWTDPDIGSSVSRLGNLALKNLGPNTLQKVMAGDKVSAQTVYYYASATGGTNPNLVTTVLSSLGQSISNGPVTGGLVKSNATAITSQLNVTPGFSTAVTPAGSGGTTPLAFLTILFFDERFNFVSAADGGVHQQQVASSITGAGLPLQILNVKAPKNGYVYVYLSNRSDQHVYFDNFSVGIARGNIAEEDHYYAFGLRISTISSQKTGDINSGKISNDFLYNAKELLDKDSDLGWYDYGFRNYDPQIARFVQLDPLTDDYPSLTPFQYASNDPIGNIDIDGLEGGIATTAKTAKVLQEVVVTATKQVTNFGRQILLNVTSITIQALTVTNNVVNGNTATKPAGKSGFDPNGDDDDPPINKPFSITRSYTEMVTTYVDVEITQASWGGVKFATATSLALVADDATVVGVIDDIAIPFIFLAGYAYDVFSAPKTRTVAYPVTVPVVKTRRIPQQLIYVTYTKYNPTTGQTYVGRTSGYGDPASIVRKRDYAHKDKDAVGFKAAVVDRALPATRSWLLRRYDPSYQAIRGREQLYIEHLGGPLSKRCANAIHGVGVLNTRRTLYLLMGMTLGGFP